MVDRSPVTYLRVTSEGGNMVIGYPHVVEVDASLPSPAGQHVQVPVQGGSATPRVAVHGSYFFSVGHVPQLHHAFTVAHSKHISLLAKTKKGPLA